MRYAENLGSWYYNGFRQHYSDNESLPISPVAYLLFSQYQKTVAQLEAAITDYEFLKNQLRNLPNLLTDLQNKKNNINHNINLLKKQSQKRRNEEKYQYDIEKQQLL